MARHGLIPVMAPDCRILILGSFPSEISLTSDEYYANPRNSFWRIMQDLFDIRIDLPYRTRTATLVTLGIGLWDVYDSCIRTGSLDATITDQIPSDLDFILRTHEKITHVILNGREAEKGWRKFFETRKDRYKGLNVRYLPSTSPAHTMPYQEKRERWSILVDYIKRDFE